MICILNTMISLLKTAQSEVYFFCKRMSHNSFIMVNLSAGLLAIAYLFSPVCHWLCFFFLIPLFYSNEIKENGKNKEIGLCSFAMGFLWGLIFFSLHWGALVPIFATRSHAPHALIAFFFLLLYGALHAGVWFWCARFILFPVATCIYFLWMRYAVFWIFGIGGYPFAWPLLPLAEDARWLFAMPYLREEGLLVATLFAQYFFVKGLVQQCMKYVALSCACMIPFLIGWLMPCSVQKPPPVLSHVTYAPVIPCSTPYALDRAQEINDAMVHARQKKPHASIILMPESTYPWALNSDEDMVQLWADNALVDGVTLIIGAYYHDHAKNAKYNGLYAITRDGIQHFYGKRRLVPFIEYMSWPWQISHWCCALFLDGRAGFCAGAEISAVCLGDGVMWELLVCSDLFLGSYKFECDKPLLCIVNDSWFEVRPLSTLMFLFAKSAAMLAGQDMIYVSYLQGAWIGRDGRAFSL